VELRDRWKKNDLTLYGALQSHNPTDDPLFRSARGAGEQNAKHETIHDMVALRRVSITPTGTQKRGNEEVDRFDCCRFQSGSSLLSGLFTLVLCFI
jgi:hypothetical protein